MATEPLEDFMKRMYAVLAVVGALAAAATTQAKDLYVNASTGNDSVSYADNDASRPWRTLGRAIWGSTSISSPSTAQAARAGDTVIVAAGTYDTNAATGSRYTPIYNPVNRGSAGSPITVRAQSPGTVTLQSASSSDAQPIIGALNNAYIVWDGFVIDERNVPTRADTGPVVVWSSQHVTLQNLTIRGFNRNWVDNHNGIRLENVADIVVRNNHISGFLESQNNHNSNALTIYNGTRVLIENNEVENANAGLHVKCCSPGPVTLRYNLLRNAGRSLIFSGVEQAVAYSNVIIGAESALTFNIYSATNGVGNVTVANNTIVNTANAGDGLLIRDGMELHQSLRAYNNVISNVRSCMTTWEPSISPALTSAYNTFHNCLTTFAEIGSSRVTWSSWQGLGKDVQGSRVITGSPGFVNAAAGDYRPAAGSTLLGAGLDVLDLNGNGSTTDTVNAGAYALGNEVIGRRSVAATIPNPPTNVRAE